MIQQKSKKKVTRHSCMEIMNKQLNDLHKQSALIHHRLDFTVIERHDICKESNSNKLFKIQKRPYKLIQITIKYFY